MEPIQGSETSANYNLTPGKYPKEHFQSSFKVFLPKFLYALLKDSTHATCRAHLIPLHLIALILDAQQKPWSSSFRSFLRSPLTSSSLAPCSRTPSEFALPLQRQSQIRTNRATVCTFMFLDSRWEDRICRTELWQEFSGYNKLLISSWMQCSCGILFLKVWYLPF